MKPCRHAGRRRDERARAGAEGLVAVRELELALEHVEAVGVVVVGVRVGPVVAVAEDVELEHRQMRQRALDQRDADVVLEPLALAGPGVHRLVHDRAS